ncbi:MAG: lysoplasmalogenase [Burkholderiales bacterium]|nr:lysoplasmalogenase [Burkholderiales bacterium]
MKSLLTGYVVCALVALLAERSLLDLRVLFVVAKPLTLVFAIAHAAGRGDRGSMRWRATLLALGLSLVGDVALLWPRQGFLPGLVAFLLAHLAYLFAFTREQRFAAQRAPFAVYGAVAAAILALLWPGVPSGLRVPVLAYVVCLSAMAAQTAVAWWRLRGSGTPAEGGARLAAIGGLLFMTSDALLAINRFGQPLPLAGLWILGTYWSAQWLIASSLPPRR